MSAIDWQLAKERSMLLSCPAFGTIQPDADPIEGCWNVLKAKRRRFMATKEEEEFCTRRL